MDMRTCADSFGGTSTTVSPVVHQPVHDVPADAVAALDRPDPIGKPAARLEHLGIAGAVRAEPADRQPPPGLIDDLDGGRPLVRIHPQ